MKKLTPELALTRARRGIEFLNRRRPGWRKLIKPSRLDMARGGMNARRGSCGCILAQLDLQVSGHGFGFYARGAETVGVNPVGRRAVALGFRNSDDSGQMNRDYALLTEAWRQALAEEAT